MGQSIYDINLVIYELNNNDCVIISSYINDNIVASAYIKTLELENEEVLLLDKMVVRSELRNRGIGTQLMYFIIRSKDELNEIFKKDCQRIIVNPLHKNSEELCNKIGFEYIDDRFMGRKL